MEQASLPHQKQGSAFQNVQSTLCRLEDKFKRVGISLWVLLLSLINAGAILYGLNSLNDLTTLLCLTLVLGYLLWPLLRGLQFVLFSLMRFLGFYPSRSWPRVPRSLRFISLTLVFGSVGFALIYGVVTVLPTVAKQALELLHSLPQRLIELESTGYELLPRLHALGLLPLVQNQQDIHGLLQSTLQPFIPLLEQSLNNASGWVSHSLELILSKLFFVVMLFVFLFYTLMDAPKLTFLLVQQCPSLWRQALWDNLKQFHEIMMAYIKGQVLFAFLTGVYMLIIYSVFGVSYAPLFALLFGLGELLPIVGTWVGFAPGITWLVLQGDFSTLLGVFLCSYAYQSVKDNVLQPAVVGTALGLHPVIMLLSILVCGKFGGVIGVMLAIPMAGMLVLLLQRKPVALSDSSEPTQAVASPSFKEAN